MDEGEGRTDAKREIEEGNRRQEPSQQRSRQRPNRQRADEEGQGDEIEERRAETAVLSCIRAQGAGTTLAFEADLRYL